MSQPNVTDVVNKITSITQPTKEVDTLKFLEEETTEVEKPLDLEPKKSTKPIVEDEEETDTEKTDEEGETEDDELKEIEKEIEEPNEEELELVVPTRIRDIKAKYPKIFKEFPYLESAYYRVQKYAEIVPTIEDAREAVERAGVLEKYEGYLSNGSLTEVLSSVRENDPQAFTKLVDNYMPALAKADPNAYYHVASNVIKEAMRAMVRTKDDSLLEAAQLINSFFFNTREFEPPTKLSKEEDTTTNKDEERISEKEQKLIQQQFEYTRSNLDTRVTNTIKATIATNIDPKSQMSDYVKTNAIRDVQEKLEAALENDRGFTQLIDKLWERAFASDFSEESTNRLKSAYLSKSKTLLPTIIAEARKNALQGLGKRIDDNGEGKSKKGPLPVGNSRHSTSISSGANVNYREEAKKLPRGTKTIDFLNQD